MFSDFHFLNPWWLLALMPLALLLWLSASGQGASSAWRRVIDERLLPVLTIEPAELNRFAARLPLMLLGLGWLIATLALANPTFERKPVPTYSGGADRVVVLDLSRSMLAADLTPNRLARARYKVADILARVKDGRVGLIAFAGDAFTVSPLTQDAATITAMLEALQPEIMPVAGSRPDLALERAGALLEQAGAQGGEVVLISDDAGDSRARAAAEALAAKGYRLAVIGVGTEEGAPVPGVRRAEGPVMAKLDTDALRALARAGNGAYTPLTSDDRDLATVLRSSTAGRALPAVLTENQAQAWYPLGPWIVLALLPLAALAFRRSWLLVTLPFVLGPMLTLAPAPAQALGWDDLWWRSDQQAAQAMAEQDHQRARELARDPQRRGTAAYRAGDYQSAAEDFAAGETATDHYNRGNALARAGALEDALAAYEEALTQDPAQEDARYNRDQVKAALEQQQQQEQQSGDSGDQNEEQDQESGQDQGQNQDQGESGQNESEQNQSGQSDSDQPQGDDQQDGSEQEQSGGPDDQQEEQNKANAGQEPSDGDTNEQSDAQQPQQQQSGADQDQPAGEDEIESGRDQQAEQQAAEDYRAAAEAAQSADAETGDENEQAAAAGQSADQSPEEQEARAAADQWLRRIPDDPAGLLRRKFLYQYSQRAGPEQGVAAGEPW
ncbi:MULTISPECIES: VWA domain-containing protein [Thiorhodovibrio]|uniref:VWA domain-containing protein n=1 Tax=Thiorhodovibrio TaxID=61593 RepID=UPI0019114A9B|nr:MULTISPECIES: VWA domain-containing protein [Thiorhodovibrio]MBK5969077.1 hypothetical protein [Thiorhodovibrio winogradskyi]WPL14730.1 Deacetylase [Thiorhodovibrio litoralis]